MGKYFLRRCTISAVLVVSASATLSNFSNADAAGFEVIAPHRAIYDLKLDKASERSGIKAMTGRIVYEVRGNECEGITVKYRYQTTVTTARDQFISDQHTSTYESPDGNSFDFLTKTFLNSQLERTVKGRAVLEGSGLHVRLKEPKPVDFDFSKARFLSGHITDIIAKAKAGDTIFRQDIFDGTGDADEILSTSTIISRQKSEDFRESDIDDETAKKLKGNRVWPVSMSYFEKGLGATAEHLPVFESSFLLYENGVSSRLIMRYPDYSLKANLSKLDLLKRDTCKKDG